MGTCISGWFLMQDDSYYQASLTDGTIGLVHEKRIVLRKAIPLLPMP